MVTVPLHKMSAPCSNALHCPFPHVQHCPHRHGRINLRNLPDDVGLQLVEGGRTRAVNLGFEAAPLAEVKEGEVGRSRRLLPTFDQIPKNNKVQSPSFRINI